MPSFGKTELSIRSDIQSGAKEIDKFRIETRPNGFRRILCFWPYITGSKPKFHCKVIRLTNKKRIGFNVRLCSSHLRGNDAIENEIVFSSGMDDDIKQQQFEFNFEDEMIGESGEYAYDAAIHVGVWSEKAKVVSFKAMAQEDITLTILALLAGFIISLLTWLLTRGSSPTH